MSRYLSKIALFDRGRVGHFERKFQGERGVSHQRIFASENQSPWAIVYGENNCRKFQPAE